MVRKMYVKETAIPAPTKLTLRLDATLIDRAKQFALEHDRSVSQLVADYFVHLEPAAQVAGKAQMRRTAVRKPARPITAGLRGALRKGDQTKVLAGRDAYRAHLEEKYL